MSTGVLAGLFLAIVAYLLYTNMRKHKKKLKAFLKSFLGHEV